MGFPIIFIVSSRMHDKWDEFNLEMVNYPFLDGDIPHSPSHGVYIRSCVRECSYASDFNNRNQF